jgi:hypothetical protein
MRQDWCAKMDCSSVTNHVLFLRVLAIAVAFAGQIKISVADQSPTHGDPFFFEIHRTGTSVVVVWAGTFQLQRAPNVQGPWTTVINAVSPYMESTAGVPSQFFRLR